MRCVVREAPIGHRSPKYDPAPWISHKAGRATPPCPLIPAPTGSNKLHKTGQATKSHHCKPAQHALTAPCTFQEPKTQIQAVQDNRCLRCDVGPAESMN